MTTEAELNRLKWQCRRGMLELDLFLQNFLEGSYNKLPQKDQGLFAELLSNTDQDLYAWLTGQEEPSNEAFKRMVKLIRQQPKTIF
ncbi:MAG: hypothetical protein A3E87_04335 [Gammaproteobacteria bacterium RIFCSPHIGHO2_12_FULL_35_23]|nr:MAG: hypothetical protein A3E87_04335 [Gammaproteobacteria bacterium RIFCSPHIGHO2_12_FULL_35_23]